MSLSIYNISEWSPSTIYKINDIVKVTSGNSVTYYYAKQDHTSGGSFSSSLWEGTTTYNGETVPCFFWRPSYNSQAVEEPRTSVVKLGDGYEQRISENLTNSLLMMELTFEGKTSEEVTAIVHFLNTRGASESFIWTPPPPYATRRRFVCRGWATSFNFYNNHTVKTKFEEVVN